MVSGQFLHIITKYKKILKNLTVKNKKRIHYIPTKNKYLLKGRYIK